MSDVQAAGTAVRSYLRYLQDPSCLVDPEHIERLEADVAAATDPLDKLKAMAALSRARSVDGAQYERGFVQYASSWARENDVPATTFAEFGVPEPVLRSAGLRGGKGTRAKTTAGGGAVPTESINVGRIKDYVTTMKAKTFTMADLSSTVGGSPMTVRKAVDELIRAGSVRRLGPRAPWSGRGRAPIVFERETD